MAKKTFPLGTANTLSGHPGGLGHPSTGVDSVPALKEITPRTAQTNKYNYKKSPSGKQGNG